MPMNSFVAMTLFMAGLRPAYPQTQAIMSQVKSQVAQFTNSGHFHPVWAERGLYGADFNPSDEPILWRVGTDGNREDLRFSFPGGRHITLTGAAEAPDGGIVVIGGSLSDDGRGGTFLSRIAPGREAKTITRLSPFVPKQVTVSADGVIWVLGFLRGNDIQTVEKYNVLDRFDPSGKLLSSFALQVKGLPWGAGGDATEWSVLRASQDRVGWLTTGNQYLEFSLDGREISRREGPPSRILHDEGRASLVLSASNKVFIGLASDNTPTAVLRLWSLDRAQNAWVQIAAPNLSGRTHLCGSDGDAIVATETTADPTGTPIQTIFRYAISQAAVAKQK